MSQKKVKILGIAPYEGMKSMMTRIASQRDDVDLSVFVGDLNEGVEIAKRNIGSNCDVIISRGGTAQMISKITEIPLIEINISVYDILRTIKLAENYSEKYAIVGYPAIITSAQLLCDVLQSNIDHFTIHSKEEASETLKMLKAQGYKMVLSDMITTTLAKRMGMNAILITSGEESIKSAIDQAVKLYKSYIHVKEDNKFLEEIIRGNGDNVIVFDNNDSIIFDSITTDDTETITDILRSEIPNTLKLGNHKLYKTINENLYTIQCKKILNQDREYAVYYFRYDKAPSTGQLNGINYYNKAQVEDSFFNSFFSIINTTSKNHYDIEQLSLNKSPIMLTGEVGTGKSQMANLLYTFHPYSNNPMVNIDCGLLNEKGMKFLTTNTNSPLLDKSNVIFLSDLHKLSDKNALDLLSLIRDLDLHKRNKLIISCVNTSDESKLAIRLEYMNKLQCSNIHMDPLRDKIEEIPDASSLYLGNLNLNTTNQVLGFDSDAIALLQEYDWPYNYTQFKRVLNELSLITTTPYITKDNVKSILQQETAILANSSGAQIDSEDTFHLKLDASMTLDDISKEVIKRYLKLNNDNLTTTAKQLGISRTTLWRHLK